MSTHGNTSENSGSLLGWLGLRGNSGKRLPHSPPTGAALTTAATVDLGKEARRQLLDALSAFFLDNDLEVSAGNLLAIHAAFSGINPGLARQITARIEAGEPITQAWLDEVAGGEGKDQTIERLIARFETGLDSFAKSTKAARTATSDYNTELEQHVAELDQVEDTGAIISDLAALAKVMLERTRKVEDEMRRSEQEAKTLRKNLARAKRDAEIDHLTGLPNRRAFEALLDHHYREAQAAIEPLAVAFCDIDHFKRINDVHGHDTGDRIIQAIGEALSAISNDNCHVARHGGEEFVMLFRGLTPREAQQRLDQLRERFAQRNFINRQTDEPMGQITFSGGVADVFAYADPRAALRAADEALYRAKEAGRNRIERA